MANQDAMNAILAQLQQAYMGSQPDQGPTVAERRAERGRNTSMGAMMGEASGIPMGAQMGGLAGSQWGEESPIGGGDLGDQASDYGPAAMAYGGNMSDMTGAMTGAMNTGSQMGQMAGPMALASNWDQMRRFAKEPGERFERGGEKIKQNLGKAENIVKGLF